jgi:hypothetical protein
MNVLNTHERLVSRPLPEVFSELVALGTSADQIWSDPKTPFRRTDGPMRVEVTREQHGAFRAILDTYEVNQRIVWRADMRFLRGSHTFEAQEVEGGFTLVRHIVRVSLPWWYGLIWRFYVSGIHNRIMEGMLDRLAGQREQNVARQQ